jgi:GR25 family glycosyltransferase involved in LPS biosynthesis
MKKGFNNFDILYYINLEHRNDRKVHILEELKKTGIDHNKINRIEAIHKEFGELGCSQSHIKALETFLQTTDDVQNCLILEDDFKLKTDNFDHLDIVFDSDIDYDVLMISGNLYHTLQTNVSLLRKVYEAQAASGYCVTKQYAPKLLENFKEGAKLLEEAGKKVHELCLDQYWKKLQIGDKWYALNPMIAEQMMSYSDIEKKVVYYGV